MAAQDRISVNVRHTVVLYSVAALAGMIAGMLYHQVGRHVDLAIVFPALAGVLAGAAVALAARACRCSPTRAALLAGALAGGIAFASSLYFDYREFRDVLATSGVPGPRLPAAQVDRLERQLFGDTGLLPYLNARARYGTDSASGHAAVVQGDAEWLLWLTEAGVAAGAGSAVVLRAARRSPRSGGMRYLLLTPGLPA